MIFDKLIPEDREKERIEMQQKKKQEFKKIGSTRRVPGHTMFSYNMETHILKKADMVFSDTVDLSGMPMHNARIIIEKDCIYRQALNFKNAVKHLKKEGFTEFEIV